jgi:hypothetical protein
VEEFRDRTTTIGSLSRCRRVAPPGLGRRTKKRNQLRNGAQLHFVFASFPVSIMGARGELSRVEMNALRAPLTALPVPKGICRLFLLDGAGALIDGQLCRLRVEVQDAHADSQW